MPDTKWGAWCLRRIASKTLIYSASHIYNDGVQIKDRGDVNYRRVGVQAAGVEGPAGLAGALTHSLGP